MERSELGKLVYVQCIVALHVRIGRLVLLAMATSAILLAVLILMCVGCHGHDMYSNVMENSMKDVGESRLVGTQLVGPLQQCLNEEQKSSVTRMDHVRVHKLLIMYITNH